MSLQDARTTLLRGAVFVIPVAQTEVANGAILEGRGVIPDLEVKHEIKALLAGRDTQLEAALEHLSKAKED